MEVVLCMYVAMYLRVSVHYLVESNLKFKRFRENVVSKDINLNMCIIFQSNCNGMSYMMQAVYDENLCIWHKVIVFWNEK